MYFLDSSYSTVFALASAAPPSADHWGRQLFSLWFIVSLGGVFFYLFFAALSYRFMYDERLTAHPKVMICTADSPFNLLAFLINMPQFLKDQVKRELSVALNSIPTMQEHPSVP